MAHGTEGEGQAWVGLGYEGWRDMRRDLCDQMAHVCVSLSGISSVIVECGFVSFRSFR